MKILKQLPPTAVQDAIDLAKSLWSDTHDEELFDKYGLRENSTPGMGYMFSPSEGSRLELALQRKDKVYAGDSRFSFYPHIRWRGDVPITTQVVAALALDFLRQMPAPPADSDIRIPPLVLEGSVELLDCDKYLLGKGSPNDWAMARVAATLENSSRFWLEDRWDCPVCIDDDCEMDSHTLGYYLPRHDLVLSFYSYGLMELEPLNFPVFSGGHGNDDARKLAEEWNQKYGVWLRGVGYWNGAFPEWATDSDDPVDLALQTGFSMETLQQLATLTDEQITDIVAFYNAQEAPSNAPDLSVIAMIADSCIEKEIANTTAYYLGQETPEKYLSPFTNKEE